ncbi:MAG: hypothetical protein J5I98_03590 [Phaeodactylibacter sp.]|nr:hypothetical protein [Phaeodactylibacter sp.]
MEYRIRIQPGKENAFLQIIQALQSLGVAESVELISEPAESPEEEREAQLSSSEEMASQYRDLVD